MTPAALTVPGVTVLVAVLAAPGVCVLVAVPGMLAVVAVADGVAVKVCVGRVPLLASAVAVFWKMSAALLLVGPSSQRKKSAFAAVATSKSPITNRPKLSANVVCFFMSPPEHGTQGSLLHRRLGLGVYSPALPMFV
jgi:hypothetical protein